MGGLFSSESKKSPRQSTTYHTSTQSKVQDRNWYESARNVQRQRQQCQPSSNNYQSQYSDSYVPIIDWNNLSRNFESLNVTLRQTKPPTRVEKTNILNIQYDFYFNPRQVVTFIQLQQYDSEYVEVSRKVTNKKKFKIDSIEKIENPYLKVAYELKKEQKSKQYPFYEELLLFHGTKNENLMDICKYNFNWRLCKAHKFGKGVSFSPNSTYASNYSDENLYNKVMIVAKVLIGRSCIGNENMTLPNDGCDTSQKGADRIVIVKYEDNEFYPAYKINYHFAAQNNGTQRNNKQALGQAIYYMHDDYYN